jgi:hypothetical protein
VYRVTLLPVIRDMFNNTMHDPVDLVFSTGAPFVNSAVAGMVWDRITGSPMKDMEVMASPERDSTEEYVARSDTGGIYVFRYVPPGHYRVTAFDDLNRNGRVDPSETRGTQTLVLTGPDTVLPLDVAALRPDTTPAHVKSAEALDSLTVAVSMDHYMAPAEPDSQIRVSLSRDTGSAPAVRRLFNEFEYGQWVAQYRDSVDRVDSIAAAAAARAGAGKAPPDTAARDTSRTPPDTGRVRADTTPRAGTKAAPKRYLPPLLPGGTTPSPGGGRRPGAGGGGAQGGLGPDGRPLPKQRIVLVLDSALVPGVAYKVRVDGVVTVNGVPMKGPDTTRVTLRKDTTKAAKDTAGVKGDTARAKGDTSLVRGPPAIPVMSRRRAHGHARIPDWGVPGFAALPAKRNGGR